VPTAPEPGPNPLELPDPCLVVLVGAAGSGKSTLAARLFQPDQVLSSDTFRELVSGDPTNQAVSKVAFSILHRELDRRLRARLTTVVDATNVTSFARRALLRRASRHGIPAIAIVLDLEPSLVLARNATRPGRIVPSSAVENQLESLARSLRRDELALEGFATIHRLRTATEVDSLVT
jgi:protein phosphatase